MGIRLTHVTTQTVTWTIIDEKSWLSAEKKKNGKIEYVTRYDYIALWLQVKSNLKINFYERKNKNEIIILVVYWIALSFVNFDIILYLMLVWSIHRIKTVYFSFVHQIWFEHWKINRKKVNAWEYLPSILNIEKKKKYRSLLSIFNAKTHFAMHFRRECLSQR